jgi:sugar/nucleoside kinase (ribokinase family)
VQIHATIILGMEIVSLGDLLLDVIVALDAPLVAGDDRVATTRVGAGGQAANVAAWAAALGAEACFVGKRGTDMAAALLRSELEARGAQLAGPCEGRSGVVVSFSSATERSMASDRGSAPALRPEELEAEWFRCRVLHVSGYALAAEPIATAAERAVALARETGAQVSLDLSAETLIDERFRTRARSLAPDLVFATEGEWERMGGCDARVLLKRGADGIRLDGVDHAARPTDLIDTTGAGDALAAGFLVGGVELALETAARCCARLGSMP